MQRRRLTMQDKATIVARSYAIGVKAAADEAGLGHSTVRYWREMPEFKDLAYTHRDELSKRLRITLNLALQKVEEGLNDPRSKLHEKVRAVEVLHNSLQLIEGGPTQRVESANLNLSAAVNVPPPLLDEGEFQLLSRYVGLLEAGQAPALHERITEGEAKDVG